MVFYILLSRGMSRSQEREADRLMVQIDGRANAQAALREVYVLTALLVVLPTPNISVSVGDWIWRRPPMASSGGSTNCSSLVQTKSMRSAKKVPPEEPAEKSRQQMAEEMLNTHPPIGVRIAAMESIPDCAQARPYDDRRACALIPDFAKAAAATAEVAFIFGYRERLEWDELVGRIRTTQ